MKVDNILITIEQPDFDPMKRFSAVARVIYSFGELLQSNGYEVFINTHKVSKLLHLPISERTSSRLAKLKPIYKLVPKRTREIIKDLTLFKKLKYLEKDLKELPKPDIIISWISYGSSISVDLSKHWNIPLVSIFDNPLNEEYKFLFGFYPFFHKRITFHEKRMLANASAIIAYSPAVSEYIKKTVPIGDTPFFYKAFTDFKRMTFRKYERNYDIIRFAYIGSFFNWHKLDELIDTFEGVYLEDLEFELYLVGDGPEFPGIQEKIDALSWKDRIIMTGNLDGDQLDELIESVHVGIVSNALWYQAPVKLFQYSAAGLCVLAKKTPTIAYLFRNAKGYYFFDSFAELNDKINSLIANKETIEEAGDSAREFVFKNFSRDNYLQFFKNMFQAL